MRQTLVDRELTLPAYRFPRTYHCSNPFCLKPARCPGEPCKACRAQQEAARAAFRLVLERIA